MRQQRPAAALDAAHRLVDGPLGAGVENAAQPVVEEIMPLFGDRPRRLPGVLGAVRRGGRAERAGQLTMHRVERGEITVWRPGAGADLGADIAAQILRGLPLQGPAV